MLARFRAVHRIFWHAQKPIKTSISRVYIVPSPIVPGHNIMNWYTYGFSPIVFFSMHKISLFSAQRRSRAKLLSWWKVSQCCMWFLLSSITRYTSDVQGIALFIRLRSMWSIFCLFQWFLKIKLEVAFSVLLLLVYFYHFTRCTTTVHMLQLVC